MPLPLPLLVTRVLLADDPHDPPASDHLAMLTDRLHAASYLHSLLPRFLGQLFNIPGIASQIKVVPPSSNPRPAVSPSIHHLVSTRTPSSTIATVCSKCALRRPSTVATVQRSFNVRTSLEPSLIMGSMASTIPGRSRSPRPGRPKFGTCGSSCGSRPIPCPTSSRTTL